MKTFLKIFALSIALFAIGTPNLSAQSSRTATRTASPSSNIKLSVAPNPCQGQVMVNYLAEAKAGGGIIEVIQQGKGVVMQIPISGFGRMPLNLSGLPKGVHYVRLVTPTSSVGTRVMIR